MNLRTISRTDGTRLNAGFYLLNVKDNGRCNAIRINQQQLRRIIIDVLGEE